MDKKQANLAFHHSERLKSNLFLVSAALDRLAMLKAERLEGGKEVTKGVLDALRTELNMARRYVEPAEANAIERALSEVDAELETHDYAKAREHLAQTFSQVTTVSDKYIKLLMDEDLI
jgi:lysyl-tRNA synthetase class I